MRKYICNEDMSVRTRPCHFSKYCWSSDCAPRYVRADVAIRYARMRERKGYVLASEDVDCYKIKCRHWSGMGYCREHRDCVNGNVLSYDEAIAAQQKDKGEA